MYRFNAVPNFKPSDLTLAQAFLKILLLSIFIIVCDEELSSTFMSIFLSCYFDIYKYNKNILSNVSVSYDWVPWVWCNDRNTQWDYWNPRELTKQKNWSNFDQF